MSNRITKFWLENEYIDISVQKGGIPGVSGCLEHTSVLTQLIKDTVKNKGNLAVIWLDLANAYGTIPHKLIEITLEKYHVPVELREMIMDYYSNFHIRFSTKDFTTALQELEIGIITGCTLSVILFCGAMNLVVKSTEKKSRGAKTNSSMTQPPNKAFVDDMTITTKSVVEGRWTLSELVEVFEWARMKFKASKSRSLVISKGKVSNQYRFKVNSEWIPTLSEKPVKCLGKWYRAALNDKTSIEEAYNQLKEWLQAVEKCGLPGRFKAWIYQHGILPRLLWPLLIYEIPISQVERMELLVNKLLKKWLGVPKSFSSIGLFSSSSKLQLPLKSVLDQYQITKVRKVMMLDNSKDSCVNSANIQIDCGRKWKASEAVSNAKQRLMHKDLVGTVVRGREGLGCSPRQSWYGANARQKRQLVEGEVQSMQEEQRVVRAASMSKQGSWLNWESIPAKKTTWKDLLTMEPLQISFRLRSVYDLLPSPSNLCLWNITDTPNCKLCDKPANLKHILSSCKTSLTGGRYKWRHDRVLSVIAHHLALAVKTKRKSNNKLVMINFIKPGAKSKAPETGLLHTAADWELLTDLKTQLKIPEQIAITRKRPDIVLWSKVTKQVVFIELTIPWEEGVDEAHERKLTSYNELVGDCRSNGWKTWCLPVEVGTRGFAAQSLWRCLKLLGITGKARGQLIREAERVAEASSRWIFEKRDSSWQQETHQDQITSENTTVCQSKPKCTEKKKIQRKVY